MKRGLPVVLTGGCPATAALVGKWRFDYLAEAYGPKSDLSVHIAPRKVRRFERFYGRGLGKGAVTGMSFRQFVDTMESNERSTPEPPWRYYMQAPVMWSRSSKGGRYNAINRNVLTSLCPRW